MAKAKIKSTDEWIIDVDIVIANHNKSNPDNLIDRKKLAKILQCNVQSFAEWKQGRTPKLIFRILKMMEIGNCDAKTFITKNN